MSFPGATVSLLSSMPAEILREIASSVDAAKDTSALCTVSRLFNAVTVPVLYRNLDLGTVESTLRCFETLIRHPTRHGYVRSVRIEILASDERDYIPTDLIFPLESVLRTLRHLEHLYLRIPDFDDRFLVIFATLALPNLHTFSIIHPGSFSPLLSSFLNRHPHLTHLDLLRPFIRPPKHHNPNCKRHRKKPPIVLPLLHFPRLRAFRGCSVYAAALVVAGRTLARVELWGAPKDTDLDALFVALGDCAARRFALTVLWDGPQTALFAPLVRCIPHTTALITGPFVGGMRPLSKPTITEIATALEALPGLRAFEYDNVESEDVGLRELLGVAAVPNSNAGGLSIGMLASIARHGNTNNLDLQTNNNNPYINASPLALDHAALCLWGARCPSLGVVRLHCRTWSRDKTGSGKWLLLS
ncbi:hypothetical protein C8R43DRAFT_1049912 [Mycena crocata]|nr:hypothetical protein C8R43DRAFT_1049912 [Mycena crocata]